MVTNMAGGPVNIQQVNDSMRERVREAVIGAVPQEQWDALIQATLKEFFEKPSDDRSRWGGESRAPFVVLLHKVAEEIVRERVQEVLRAGFTSVWDTDLQQHVNENLSKLLADAAPAMIASIFRQHAQAVIASLQRP